MTSSLILIVEDDHEIAEILQAFLERNGCRVVIARDGVAGLEAQRMLAPDLVVLDVRLPRMDGLAVLAELRRRGAVPVIMASALGDDLDKLTALRLGADDYMVKPFNPAELVARVRAVLRRAQGTPSQEVVRVGVLEVDLTAHQLRVSPDVAAGASPRVVEVTPTEFRILAHMARAPRKAFSRGEIADACLPTEGNALDRTVDSHIANLRAKLSAAGAGGHLEGVRGVGYRLVAP